MKSWLNFYILLQNNLRMRIDFGATRGETIATNTNLRYQSYRLWLYLLIAIDAKKVLGKKSKSKKRRKPEKQYISLRRREKGKKEMMLEGKKLDKNDFFRLKYKERMRGSSLPAFSHPGEEISPRGRGELSICNVHYISSWYDPSFPQSFTSLSLNFTTVFPSSTLLRHLSTH